MLILIFDTLYYRKQFQYKYIVRIWILMDLYLIIIFTHQRYLTLSFIILQI